MVFQLASPLLDACVLAVLDQQDAYGYLLTQQIRRIVNISESTLYPVLRRLQKDEMLTTYDQPFQGRNRRYYQITEDGREKLLFYREEWDAYKESISSILVPRINEVKQAGEEIGQEKTESVVKMENADMQQIGLESVAEPEIEVVQQTKEERGGIK